MCAGLIAGLSMVFVRSPVISLYVSWKALEASCCTCIIISVSLYPLMCYVMCYVVRLSISRLLKVAMPSPGTMVMLYCSLSQQQLCSTRCVTVSCDPALAILLTRTAVSCDYIYSGFQSSCICNMSRAEVDLSRR